MDEIKVGFGDFLGIFSIICSSDTTNKTSFPASCAGESISPVPSYPANEAFSAPPLFAIFTVFEAGRAILIRFPPLLSRPPSPKHGAFEYRAIPADGPLGPVAAARGGGEGVMAQSDRYPSATAETNIDAPKAAFPSWLQLPGGDGGGFHVAKGKRGASWNPATSRPGTCQGGAFACWHLAWPSRLEQAG